MGNRRIEEVENYIREHNSATVLELCKKFGVSDMTIRRDLIQLEKENRIIRFHGGATTFKGSDAEEIEVRTQLARNEKEEIALLTNEYMNIYIKQYHPKILFLASGSTVYKAAEHLRIPSGISILTDNLQVASLLSKHPDNTVIMLGGQILLPSYNVVGYTAEDMIKSFAIDCAIIGTGAIDEDGMLYMHNMLEYSSMRAILERAKKIILVTDHSKFGKTNTISLMKVDSRFTIITDSGISDRTLEGLKKKGISIVTS